MTLLTKDELDEALGCLQRAAIVATSICDASEAFDQVVGHIQALTQKL